MQTVFESTKEFNLGVSFTNTDVSLIQECIALATEHPELSTHWTNAIVLITTMMDTPQHTLTTYIQTWFRWQYLVDMKRTLVLWLMTMSHK